MKGTNKFWLLKAAGALIIGMALLTGLVGCKTDDDDDEGGGLPAAKGKLTVTDIPADNNGKYAMAYANMGGSVMLFGIAGGDSTNLKLVKIADSTVVLPLYNGSDDSVSAYEGNDTLSVSVYILDEETIALSELTSSGFSSKIVAQTGGSVTFASGSKSVKWGAFN
jgi:hypothetical protein